jgi:hypothetical protein
MYGRSTAAPQLARAFEINLALVFPVFAFNAQT